MMSYQALFDRFWVQYTQTNPAVKKVYDLLVAEGETVINDHIALRTFDDERVNIDVLAQPFLDCGYQEAGHYDFPVKKLFAKYFLHSDQDAPKLFISQLLTAQFSESVQTTVKSCVDAIPAALLKNANELIFAECPWQPLNYPTYEQLLTESQYAAWMYAFGFCANHFTINVNALKKFNEIAKINKFLKDHGFTLNDAGGEIQGSPEVLLEQSSIKAEARPVAFKQGTYNIPACYYEFAKRYPDKNGELFTGFVAASADKIYQSTDVDKK